MEDLSSVTVVVRFAGERTGALCVRLVTDQGLSATQVHTIREAPFLAALRRSLEIGIAENRVWTLCVDADLLLRPGSIRTLIKLASRSTENTSELQGFILDKFFGGPRPGGVHLYRTALLAKALELLPSGGMEIRPENYVLNRLRAEGFPYKVVPYVVGLHDYEQYYKDIYRKTYVYSWKHIHRTEFFSSLWRPQAIDDPDYQVALRGFGAGFSDYLHVDVDVREKRFRLTAEDLGRAEKDTLKLSDWTLERVETILHTWAETREYRTEFPIRPRLKMSQRDVIGTNLATQLTSLKGTATVASWLLKKFARKLSMIG